MDFNTSQEEAVQKFYGNRLRVRSCGICVKDDAILLIKHDLGTGELWLPPGGEIKVGEKAVDCVKRELWEETGLIAKSCDFLFGCEFIKEPLHAIELFYFVDQWNGVLKKGTDPEPGGPKVILKAEFITWDKVYEMPKSQLHGIFGKASHPSKILDLKGYFTL